MFAYKHSLNRHIQTSHPGFDPDNTMKRRRSSLGDQCPLCGIIFATTDILALHMKTHTAPQNVPYQIITFPTQGPTQGVTFLQVPPVSMSAVTRTEHSSSTESTAIVNSISTHTSSATPSKVVKSVTAVEGVNGGGEVRSCEKVHPCGVCGKTFSDQHTLDAHRATHNQMYICNKCGQQFSEKEKLIEHSESQHQKKTSESQGHKQVFKPVEQSELPEKKDNMLKCLVCCLQFQNKSEFQKHHRLHLKKSDMTTSAAVSGAQHFICGVCSKKFQTRQYLEVHMLNKHTSTADCDAFDEEPYTCEYCDVKFVRTSDFVSHMKSHACDEHCKCKHCIEDEVRKIVG